MGVGIPGTGMIGLPIAIALGALVGRSEYGLEVLKDATPEAVEQGCKYIDEHAIAIDLKQGIDEKLYIEVEVFASEKRAVAIISGGHTNFVFLQQGDEVLLDARVGQSAGEGSSDEELTLRTVYEFAVN
jgi:L-cysteine desulfidase